MTNVAFDLLDFDFEHDENQILRRKKSQQLQFGLQY